MVQANTRQLYTEVNIDGTALFLECIKEVGATKALVYTSSSSIIHNNLTDLVNATEDTPLCFEPEQTEHYTHTKAVAEQIVVAANKQGNLLTTIIRAAMLFGEGDATSTPQMVENARAGRGRFQIGDGSNLFDFTYVGNTAYAHVLAAKALLRESAATRPVRRIEFRGWNTPRILYSGASHLPLRCSVALIEADTSGSHLEPLPGSNVPNDRRILRMQQENTFNFLSQIGVRDFLPKYMSYYNECVANSMVHETWSGVPDLFTFLRDLALEASVNTLCGKSFLRQSPEFSEAIWEFDANIHFLYMGFPRWWQPKAAKARQRCLDAITKWRVTAIQKSRGREISASELWNEI